MRKMDEMEMSISLNSIKWAWFYTVIFLFGWIVYDFIRTGYLGRSPASFLLITQNLILYFRQQYLKRKMGKNEK